MNDYAYAHPLHQDITVPDVDAAAKWYQDVFAFQIVKDEYTEALNCHIIFGGSGNFELEPFQYLGSDDKPLRAERTVPNEDIKTCGTKHVAYQVADMAGMTAHLLSGKSRWTLPTVPSPWGRHHLFHPG